jgi:uncharacterized membrane protein
VSSGGRAASSDLLGRWVSRVLATGTLLAIATVAVGVLLTLATGGEGGPSGVDDRGLVAQILDGKPGSIVSFGLLLLALTPLAQLVAAVGAFVRSGERRYVVISSVVLALLLVGIATATLLSRGGGG